MWSRCNRKKKYIFLMIAVSSGMYANIIFSLEANFVKKVWLYFIYNREIWEVF